MEAEARVSALEAELAELRRGVKRLRDEADELREERRQAAVARGDRACSGAFSAELDARRYAAPGQRTPAQAAAFEDRLFRVLGIVGGLGFWEAWRLPLVCRELRFGFSGGGAPADMIKLGLEKQGVWARLREARAARRDAIGQTPRSGCRPARCGRATSTPPPSALTSIRVAPASSAFSTSSLMALAGRSTTSPAAMRLTVSGGRRRMGMDSQVCRFPASGSSEL